MLIWFFCKLRIKYENIRLISNKIEFFVLKLNKFKWNIFKIKMGKIYNKLNIMNSIEVRVLIIIDYS